MTFGLRLASEIFGCNDLNANIFGQPNAMVNLVCHFAADKALGTEVNLSRGWKGPHLIESSRLYQTTTLRINLGSYSLIIDKVD